MTRNIPLTLGLSATVDEGDYADLSMFSWFAHKSRNAYYAVRRASVTGLEVRMHAQIVGPVPDGMETDHIDGDSLNNRRSNLRVCTHSQNTQNRAARTDAKRSSAFKGVNFEPKRQTWRTRIRVDGRQYTVGRFANEEDAALAYDAEAIKRFGEFARLNFVSP